MAISDPKTEGKEVFRWGNKLVSTAEQATEIAVPVLWTQKQTAEYLQVSEKWLERDRWLGATIPFIRVGRGVRYRAADVVAYLNKNVHLPE